MLDRIVDDLRYSEFKREDIGFNDPHMIEDTGHGGADKTNLIQSARDLERYRQFAFS